MEKNVHHLKSRTAVNDTDPFLADRAAFELYQAFMVGYVRRLNEATFNVTIGGVRIGSAKYSRLAQINLQSRIITFSRFAVENVPERGRRYLVLHELAHVQEANHNARFWGLVERYEPSYRKVSQELELAFRENVKDDVRRLRQLKLNNQLADRLQEAKLLLSKRLLNYKMEPKKKNEAVSQGKLILSGHTAGLIDHESSESERIIDPFKYDCEDGPAEAENSLDWSDYEFDSWDEESGEGTVHGGCLD